MARFCRLLIVGVVVGFSSLANATEYTFNKVYNSATGSFLYGAAINDNGLVALTELPSGNGNVSNIYITDGTTATKLASNNSNYDIYQYLSINNSGYVTYRTFYEGISSIVASNGNTTKVIASVSDTGAPGTIWYLGNSSMSINDAGVVAYQALTPGSSNYFVYTSDGTSTPVCVGNAYGIQPSINNNGAVAYLSGNGATISVWNGTDSVPLSSDALSGFSRPVINNNGTVACVVYANNADKIFVGNETSSTFIDGSNFSFNGITGFGLTSGFVAENGDGLSGCAINDQGLVAFWAATRHSSYSSVDDVAGIYTGSDPLADKVIATGDMLGSETVKAVNFSRNGLNEKGQIVFTATLSDGSTGVWVATPVPEPSAVVLLTLASIGLLAWSKRRAK